VLPRRLLLAESEPTHVGCYDKKITVSP
jgi:hypothetical protein